MGLTAWLRDRKERKTERKERKEEELAGQRAAKEAERKVSVAMDLFESLCSIYGSMIRFFLGQSDTAQKIISTWEMFANGLDIPDVLALCEKSGLEMSEADIIATLKASENGKYAISLSSDWKIYVNHKILVDNFFAILDGSDGVNVLSDYLEGNEYMTEDGMAIWDFKKGGTRRVFNGNSFSHLYEKVEYDPETGGAKAGT